MKRRTIVIGALIAAALLLALSIAGTVAANIKYMPGADSSNAYAYIQPDVYMVASSNGPGYTVDIRAVEGKLISSTGAASLKLYDIGLHDFKVVATLSQDESDDSASVESVFKLSELRTNDGQSSLGDLSELKHYAIGGAIGVAAPGTYTLLATLYAMDGGEWTLVPGWVSCKVVVP